MRQAIPNFKISTALLSFILVCAGVLKLTLLRWIQGIYGRVAAQFGTRPKITFANPGQVSSVLLIHFFIAFFRIFYSLFFQMLESRLVVIVFGNVMEARLLDGGLGLLVE